MLLPTSPYKATRLTASLQTKVRSFLMTKLILYQQKNKRLAESLTKNGVVAERDPDEDMASFCGLSLSTACFSFRNYLRQNKEGRHPSNRSVSASRRYRPYRQYCQCFVPPSNSSEWHLVEPPSEVPNPFLRKGKEKFLIAKEVVHIELLVQSYNKLFERAGA